MVRGKQEVAASSLEEQFASLDSAEDDLEVEARLAALKLPLDERGRRRVEARAEWATAVNQPLEIHDILAE
jgi:hypothetical protein